MKHPVIFFSSDEPIEPLEVGETKVKVITKVKSLHIQQTTRLAHQGKISCHSWFYSQHKRHDREGNSSTSLTGHASNSCTKDHGDGEKVSVWEVAEVIMLECLHPP